MAEHSPTFTRLHNLETFAVPPKAPHRHYATVPAIWGVRKASREPCVSLSSMISYCSGTFGDSGQRLNYVLPETRPKKFNMISFTRFLQVAKYGAVNPFLTARFRTSTSDDCVCATKEVYLPLLCKLRPKNLKRGLLLTIGDCAEDPVAAIISFAHAGKKN